MPCRVEPEYFPTENAPRYKSSLDPIQKSILTWIIKIIGMNKVRLLLANMVAMDENQDALRYISPVTRERFNDALKTLYHPVGTTFDGELCDLLKLLPPELQNNVLSETEGIKSWWEAHLERDAARERAAKEKIAKKVSTYIEGIHDSYTLECIIDQAKTKLEKMKK